MVGHPIIVIGASAGGLEPLKEILARLTLRERADLLRKLAALANTRGPHGGGTGFESRAEEVERQSRLLEGLLADLIAAGKEHGKESSAPPAPHEQVS